jgi:hypothetical protein
MSGVVNSATLFPLSNLPLAVRLLFNNCFNKTMEATEHGKWTIWSLSNAFTSAFKELDPIPQFKATAKLGGFLEARFSGSF